MLSKITIIILNAGVGFENPDLKTEPELTTVDLNVRAFTRLASASFRYFKVQKYGHIVGVSSITALCHTSTAPSYSASKAYVSSFLAGLRGNAISNKLNITITDIKPGFVDTPMAKAENLFWVAPVQKASEQIFNAIKHKKNHAYITKRWKIVGWIFKILPEYLLNKVLNKI